jgi:glycosyltransferase involved in cell wall biosynthesis
MWLTFRDADLVKLGECNIIHAQGPLSIKILSKLLVLKTRKVLTLHGWVLDESKALVFVARNLSEKANALLHYIMVVINWVIHRFIFIPFIYDYTTAVSDITAKKNNVKALVIPNPVICRDNLHGSSLNPASKNGEIVFITYVSIGGGKMLSIPRLIKIVYLLNQKLRSLGVKKYIVHLHIYGKDIPQSIVAKLSRIPYVRFMGYVEDYPERLKSADLFIAGYAFPELGYAALEAMCAGVPVVKFTEDPSQEEIVDGFNGMLAFSDEEILEKLVKYVLNMDELKRILAINAKNTILRRRSLKRIATIWKVVIENLKINKRRSNKCCIYANIKSRTCYIQYHLLAE